MCHSGVGMTKVLTDNQLVAFDCSAWEQKRFERWMRIDDIKAILSSYMVIYPAAKFLDLGGGTGRFSDSLLAAYDSASAVGKFFGIPLVAESAAPSQDDLTRRCFTSRGHIRPAFFRRCFVHRLFTTWWVTATPRPFSYPGGPCASVPPFSPQGRLSVVEISGTADSSIGWQAGCFTGHVMASRTCGKRMGANTARTGYTIFGRLLNRLLNGLASTSRLSRFCQPPLSMVHSASDVAKTFTLHSLLVQDILNQVVCPEGERQALPPQERRNPSCESSSLAILDRETSATSSCSGRLSPP